MTFNLNKWLSTAAIGTMVLSLATQASAQVSDGKAVLDEVIVTATKRAESLQEVPIAVSVVSGDFLTEQSINKLEDATAFIPNVTVAKGNAADSIFIRGIGSGVNQGFEQSVGTFIDGVYFGRGRASRNPFFDLARVEVLKGPQSSLFGKNTIAGAFNITSNRPTQDFEARLTGTFEPEYNGKSIEGIISGGLGDKVSVRLGTRYAESDGYFENTLSGNNGPLTDEYILRGQLLFEPTDNLEILLKAEKSENNRLGDSYALTQANPLIAALTTAVDPLSNAAFDYVRSGPGTGAVFGVEGDDTNAANYTGTINWDLGNFTLTSVTSHIEYDYEAARDADYSSLNFLVLKENQDYKAFGQELRITSPSSDTFEYIVGGFYSSEDLINNKGVDVNLNSVPPVAGFLVNVAGVPTAALTGRRNQRFSQDTTSWALFAQGTYHLADNLRLTGGLRYTEDEKESQKELFYSSLNMNDVNPLISAVYPSLGFGVNQALTERSRKEDAVTGEAIVEYDVNDDTMMFARYARGFKAGGFDEDNVQNTPASVEFESETVDAFEIGSKSTFLDGAMRLNVTGFYNAFENLQVSTFDGVASFIVGNAASAKTKGVEADMDYQVNESFDLKLAAAYLDAKYDEYPGGPSITRPDGTSAPSQDLSGRPLQFAPKITINAVAGYETAMFGDWNGRIEINGNYNDGYEVPGDLDPNLAQDSFLKLGARVSLFDDNGLSLSVIGKNLTDEKTTQWGNDLPLSTLVGTTGNNYFQYIDPPRTVTFQVSKKFQ